MVTATKTTCPRCGSGCLAQDEDFGWPVPRLYCRVCGWHEYVDPPQRLPVAEPEPPPEPDEVETPPAPPRPAGRPASARERDATIAVEMARGVDPAKLAERYGLRRGRVVKIYAAQRREAKRLGQVGPVPSMPDNRQLRFFL